MNVQALPFVLLMGLSWGSSIVATRFGVGQFDSIAFTAFRLVLASLAFALVYLLGGSKRRFPRDPNLWRHSTFLGIVGTAIPMLCIVSSMNYLSASVTSILLTLGPVITVILAHYFLDDEPLTSRKGAGVGIALFGALLLAVRGESGLGDVAHGSLPGYGLILLGLLSANYASIYIRRRMQDLDPVDVASTRMFIASAVVLPFTALTVGFDLERVDAQGVSALLYAAVVGTFVAQGLSFYVVQRFGATAAATALYVTPVTAGLGGILLLDEKITAGMLAGVGLIAIGIWIISRGWAPELEPAPQPEG